MCDPLMMSQTRDRLTIINSTSSTVLLTNAYSEDQPDVIVRPTGLESEAQEMLPGESFSILLARTTGYADFHITIEWINAGEARCSRKQRFV